MADDTQIQEPIQAPPIQLPEQPPIEVAPPEPVAAPVQEAPKDPIQELLAQDKIPNIPKVIDALRSGQADLNSVMSNYDKLKIMKSQTNGPSKDEVIQKLIDEDKIPNIPKVIDAIKMGSISADTAQENYKKLKGRLPEMIGDKEKDLNKPEDVTQVANMDLSFADRVAKNLKDTFESDMKTATYVLQKYASGLSFGVYDPEVDAPSTTAAIAGTAVNLVGWGISTALGGWALKSGLGLASKVPTVGKYAEATLGALTKLGTTREALQAEKAVGVGSKLLKGAKTVATMVPEMAGTGFVSGAGRSLVKGESFVDSMADGAIDAALFTAGGAALYPVAAAAGQLAAGVASKTGKIARARATARGAEEYFAEIASSRTIEEKISVLESMPERTEIQDRILGGLKKIQTSQPTAGPFPLAELTKDKKLMADIVGEDAKAMVEGLFTQDGAPLKNVFDSTPSLQTMIANGQYIDALTTAQTFFRQNLKQYQTIGDIAAAPFMNDAKSVSDMLTDRITGKIDPDKYPRLTRNMVMDYIENPSKEKLQELRGAVPEAGDLKKAFGIAPGRLIKEGKVAFNDLRLLPKDVDKTVGDIMRSKFESLSQGSVIKFGDLPKLAKTNDLIHAAITFNKQLSTGLMDAFKSWSPEESFIRPSKDLHGAVVSEVNIRRMATEISDEIFRKREINGRIFDIQNELKTATDDAVKASLTVELKNWQQELKNSTAKIRRFSSEINGHSNILEALPKEQQDEVRQFASKVRIPRASEELGVGEGGDYAKRTSQLMERFNYRENPNFIKAGSELNDFLNAMVVAGKDLDMSAGNLKWFSAKGINISNLSRKAMNEFGFNSPIEQYLGKIRDREAAMMLEKRKMLEEVKTIGIKSNSPEENILREFAENKISQTDPVFTALHPDMQAKMIDGKTKLRNMYDTFIDRINEVHDINNFPLVHKRDDYITHIHELNEDLPELAWRMINRIQGKDVDKIELFSGKTYNLMNAKYKNDPNKTFFRYERPREAAPENLVGAITAMEKYLDPALNRIYFTDVVRELEMARAFAPQRVGEFFDAMKNKVIGTQNFLDTKTTEGGKKVLSFLQRRMAKGSLLFNINTSLQQLASTSLSAAIGGKDAIVATTKMFTKDSAEWWAKSTNRVTRSASEGVDLEANAFNGMLKFLNKVPGSSSVKAASKYWNQWGFYFIKKFDEVATQHAYLTAVETAKRHGMKDERQIVRFADAWASRIQGSFSRVDRPEILDSVIGRSFLQFQSFAMNLGATLMNDLPAIAFHDGARTAVNSILRTYAAASITNEIARKAGMPTPLDVQSFIPLMSTFRFGVPGAPAAIGKGIYDLATGETSAKRAALRTAAVIAIPGGGQMMKTGEAIFNKKREYQIQPENRPKSLLFGQSAQLRNQAAQKARESSPLFERREKVKKKIKRLFGG